MGIVRNRRAATLLAMLALAACGRLGYEPIDDENLPTRSWDAGDSANAAGPGATVGTGSPKLDANGADAAGAGGAGSTEDADIAEARGVGGAGGASAGASTGGAPVGEDAARDAAGSADATAPADVALRDASGPDVASMRDAASETGGNVVTIDDAVEGSVLNQFHYVGTSWLHCTSCLIGPTYYDQSDSWSNGTTDFVTFSFIGTELRFYGVLDNVHGIGAVSMDGGAETMIDFYGGQTQGNQLLWTSPVMASGVHTFMLRVTGQKNPKSNDTFVTVDRVDVL
jgi:hypothetical protein